MIRVEGVSRSVHRARRVFAGLASKRGANAVGLMVVVVVAMAITVLQGRDHPQFSRVDEPQHFDYSLKAPSAGVRIGEQYGREAMRVFACRGIDLPGWVPGEPRLPSCGDPEPDPTLSHSLGYNSAYLHTPVYYTATGLVGEAVKRLPGVESSLVAYRLVGVAWLAAGLAAVWYALGLAGVGLGGRLAVVGLLGVSPMVIHASAFVNPDATGLLGGALVAVALLKWEAGRWPWWTVPVASAVAVALRMTNSAAVGVVAIYLAVRMWQQRDRVGERLKVAGASVGAAVAVVVAWRGWQNDRKLDEEHNLPLYLSERFDSFRWESLGEQIRAVVTPFRDQWIPDVLPRGALVPLGAMADIGLLVLLGAAVAFAAARSAHRALVGGVFAAMVGMGLLVMLTNYWTLSRDALAPGRYGLAIVPLAAVAVAPVLRRNVLAPILVGALAVATGAVMLHGVLVSDTSPAVAQPPDDETTLGVWCSTTSTSATWRWNEVSGADAYRVSPDGWSWEEHRDTSFTSRNLRPDADVTMQVRPVNDRGEELGPTGIGTCRTAPDGDMVVSCTATATRITFLWNQVPGATRYRVQSDLEYPWLVQTRRTRVFEQIRAGQSAELFVQAGNADGWNEEGVARASCRGGP